MNGLSSCGSPDGPFDHEDGSDGSTWANRYQSGVVSKGAVLTRERVVDLLLSLGEGAGGNVGRVCREVRDGKGVPISSCDGAKLEAGSNGWGRGETGEGQGHEV